MRMCLAVVILCVWNMPSVKAQVHSCLVLELLNYAGWAIPGLDNAMTKVTDAKVKMEGIPEGVFVDILEPRNPDAVVTLVKCVNDQLGRLEVRNQPIRVK